MTAIEELSALQSFDDKLKKTCEKMNLLDPIVLLVGLANGKDLSSHSLLYEWILNHEANNGEDPPDQWDWLELVDLIKNHARFIPVDEKTKLQAQRTLAEYQHNKKKSIEITDNQKQEAVTKLTRMEIKRFERIFKHEY